MARRNCHTFSTGFSSGARGQEDECQVLGHDQRVGGVPTRPVEQQGGMCALGDQARDLVQVALHGFCVGLGHGQTGADAPGRADRPEQIKAGIALIGRLAGPRAASGPLPDDPVLLPDAGFILEPDLDPLALREVGEMGPQRGGEVFLNSVTIRSFCAGWRGRALM